MKAIGREGSRGLGVESTRKEREERIRSNLELYQGCIDVRRATPRRMGVNMEFSIVVSVFFSKINGEENADYYDGRYRGFWNLLDFPLPLNMGPRDDHNYGFVVS